VQSSRKCQIVQTDTAVIERGIFIPSENDVCSLGTKISLIKTLRKMKSGDSFRIDKPEHRSRVFAAASYVKVKVKTQIMEDGKLLVMME
jgi:hypothetical protein